MSPYWSMYKRNSNRKNKDMMIDSQLADRIKKLAPDLSTPILIVANAYQIRVHFQDSDLAWAEIGAGDFGTDVKSCLTPRIRKDKVHWQVVSGAVSLTTPDQSNSSILSTSIVTAWEKHRQSVTGSGRKGEASKETVRTVAMRSGWHCQFAGCGKDLRSHSGTGEGGNYSYLAHIVASSPDGPRGDKARSTLLANDPDNFLLLCDECHRLIDRVDPDTYDEATLQNMRKSNIREVSQLLAALQYPEAQMLVIMSNITGQPSHFDDRDAEGALWTKKLRKGLGEPDRFCQNGFLIHNPHEPVYWESLFTSLRNDIPRLQGILSGSSRGGVRTKPLAVYPLHSTSVQILAGRLVGDVGGVHPFQFHRDQIAGNQGGQWAWPLGTVEPTISKYAMDILRDHSDEREASLMVSLTFNLAATRLPEHCASDGHYTLPTIEISVPNPAHSVIDHPKELEYFGSVVDQALQKLQDEWGVHTIHLFVGAPSTACFRIGQKLQARHHAKIICHETEPGKGGFLPTIELKASSIRLAKTGQEIDIS